MNKAQANLYRRRSSAGDDNMVPLINIVFLLLIFFMVAGKISVDHAKNIELPLAQPQAPAVVHAINVVIDAQGQMQLNGEAMSVEHLRARLDALLGKNVHAAVALQADAALQARQLMPVLAILRAAGIEKIRLFTRVGEKS